MPRTELWSLTFACRRLVRTIRGLARRADGGRGEALRQAERHLLAAASVLDQDLQRQRTAPTPAGTEALLQLLADGGEVAAAARPGADAGNQAAPGPQHRLLLQARQGFAAAPDLITFLCSTQKSGVLRLQTAGERFTIELLEGDIVHAHSSAAPVGHRLGDILVEQGALMPAQLADLVAADTSARLGVRVLERGLATRDDLLAALETQIRRLFLRLFTATVQDCQFWEGPCLFAGPALRLNATLLLLEGARLADEAALAAAD